MDLPRPQRRDDRWERLIDALDPIVHAHRIFGVLFDHIFPLDLLLSAELGQLRTFAVPSISRLLQATRQYQDDGQRRVDDTRAILSEIIIPGPQSEAGRAMIAHLGRIHGHYRIRNDDYLVTLAALAISPVEHVGRFGHRPMRLSERTAWYEVWRQVGVGMGIADVPATFDGLRAFRDAYEARAVHADPANAAIARALLQVVGANLPGPLRRLVEPSVYVLIDAPHIAAALDLQPPTPPQRALIETTLGLRRIVEGRYSAFHRARFSETRLFRDLPSYPAGYQRHLLGPRKLIAKLLAADEARR